MNTFSFLVFGILLVSFAGLMTFLVWYGDYQEAKKQQKQSPTK